MTPLALILAGALALPMSLDAQAALSAAGPERAASSSPVAGPVMGYLFDSAARGLRPILGAPGASRLGEPLPLDFALRSAAVSPSQKSALAITADEGALIALQLDGTAATGVVVSGATAGGDRIVFSPRGSAAAVYHRQGRSVEVLTDLSTQPRVGTSISLASLSGVLTALAVSDDGETLLAAASRRDGGQVYVIQGGGDPRAAASVVRGIDLAFYPGSSDAVVADFDRSEVFRISDPAGAATVTMLASAADGVRRPSAVSVAADGLTVLAAAAGKVAVIPDAGAVNLVACSCNPRSLTQLSGGGLYRLTDDPNVALQLLDLDHMNEGGQPEPRILFVPAIGNRSADAGAGTVHAAKRR